MSGTQPIYLGIDLGGTNIKAGVVDDTGTTLGFARASTNATDGPDTGSARMAEVGRNAVANAKLAMSDIHAVGLATPGTMDIPSGMLLDPPNLPGWDNYPIREKIATQLDRQTVLQNDANAAAYGEYWAGAARDADALAFWTLGTGIGGGIILNDMIVEGQNSHGSECGHMIIEMHDGRLCGTGQYGTLEAYASATALLQRLHEALEDGVQTSLRKLAERGETITPIEIGEAATAGDALADRLIMDTAMYLGVGTTTILHVIDPDMVLLGGAMTFGQNETELGRRFIQRVRDEVNKRAFPVPAKKTIIDYATLGGDAGYIGAAGCARRAFGNA